MTQNNPTILIIIGITGDLAKRKLLPAINELARADVLPENFQVLGVSRKKDITIEQVLNDLPDSEFLKMHSRLLTMDLSNLEDYQLLSRKLNDIDDELGLKAQRLFYLSVPPEGAQTIIEMLGQSGLASHSRTKLLLEKPFGRDLQSAQELVNHIDKHFKPEQVYRIDHYLAKDTVQNIVVFRSSNALFRKTWNKDFIESVNIIASEKIGIEGRANFYEQTGALRDFIQSHLVQLAGLILMDEPKNVDDIPVERLKALSKLAIAQPVGDNIQRGQYEGYRDEVGNSSSLVESFVAITLTSSDERWQDVPIHLITGKALSEKTTEVRVKYHKDNEGESDELVLRLQPNEGVEICLWAKKPGYGNEMAMHELKFNYGDHYQKLPDAYERVLLDAITSNHALFTLGEEVLESWRIVKPAQELWQNSSDITIYQPGSTVKDVVNKKKA